MSAKTRYRRRGSFCIKAVAAVLAISAACALLIPVFRIIVDTTAHPRLALLLASNYVSWIVIGVLTFVLAPVVSWPRFTIPLPVRWGFDRRPWIYTADGL